MMSPRWLSKALADGPVVVDPTIEIDPDTEAGVPFGSRKRSLGMTRERPD